MSWLSIVGMGEDGPDGLSPAARAALVGASHAFGGRRHLALAAPVLTGVAHPWLSPLSESVDAIVALEGKPVCVLASGDPFHFGIGATLARRIDPRQMRVFPHPSSFSLAAARLGWPLQDVQTISLHGRSLALIRPHLHPGARILALTSDENGPAELAQLLTEAGFGASIVTVLEALGGPGETIRSQVAMGFDLNDINPLNICALSIVALPDARILPLTPGLDDALFTHDGQITKREIRALTLSALAPRRSELLWDIGAGSGSVGIEWMLADTSLRAIAVEANEERAGRIAHNASACGVPDLQVVVGAAPAVLTDLEPPHAIFVGGGGSEPGVLDAAIAALRPGGRLVVNAVTLELEALLLARHAELGGRLTRVNVERADAIGSMTAWQPARPIVQWVWTKP